MCRGGLAGRWPDDDVYRPFSLNQSLRSDGSDPAFKKGAKEVAPAHAGELEKVEEIGRSGREASAPLGDGHRAYPGAEIGGRDPVCLGCLCDSLHELTGADAFGQ